MPDLDACISNIYADINYTVTTGTISVPQFSGYILTRDSERIAIRTRTRPPGSPTTFTVVDPLYIIGNIKRRN